MTTGKLLNNVLIQKVGEHFDISYRFDHDAKDTAIYEKFIRKICSGVRMINTLGMDLNEFFRLFVRSDIGRRI